jgi:hypothetical protein
MAYGLQMSGIAAPFFYTNKNLSGCPHYKMQKKEKLPISFIYQSRFDQLEIFVLQEKKFTQGTRDPEWVFRN